MALNSLILAVEHHGQPAFVTLFLNYANYFFVALFTAEMVLKVYSLGVTRYGVMLTMFGVQKVPGT